MKNSQRTEKEKQLKFMTYCGVGKKEQIIHSDEKMKNKITKVRLIWLFIMEEKSE